MKRAAIILLVFVVGLVCTFMFFRAVDPTVGIEYNHAFIGLPNGDCLDGPIKDYYGYNDGKIKVVFTDGTVYYTHSSNVVIIKGD